MNIRNKYWIWEGIPSQPDWGQTWGSQPGGLSGEGQGRNQTGAGTRSEVGMGPYRSNNQMQEPGMEPDGDTQMGAGARYLG